MKEISETNPPRTFTKKQTVLLYGDASIKQIREALQKAKAEVCSPVKGRRRILLRLRAQTVTTINAESVWLPKRKSKP